MKITLKQLILIFIWIKLDLTVSNRGGLHLSEQRRQNAPRWWKSWKRKNGFMSQTCHSLQAVIRGKKDQLLLQDFCRFAAPPTPLLKAERTRTAARKSSIVRGHHTEPARYSSQELLHSWRVINISLHPLSSPQSARFGADLDTSLATPLWRAAQQRCAREEAPKLSWNLVLRSQQWNDVWSLFLLRRLSSINIVEKNGVVIRLQASAVWPHSRLGVND